MNVSFSSMNNCNNVKEVPAKSVKNIYLPYFQNGSWGEVILAGDVKNPAELFDSINLGNQKVEPPKISTVRILFKRFKKEQIEEINKNKILPKNAKFVDSINGDVDITWNVADATKGTHKLPVGYELKNDLLGFTHVVREGTKAWYLK